MRHDPEHDSVFRPVAAYYKSRLELRGDVYGWGQLSSKPKPRALLLVDRKATDVPDRIEGIDIVIERVETPEPL
jgi:hypothetical protein